MQQIINTQQITPILDSEKGKRFSRLEEMVMPWQKTMRSNQNPARISLDLTRSYWIGEDLTRSGEVSLDLEAFCGGGRSGGGARWHLASPMVK